MIRSTRGLFTEVRDTRGEGRLFQERNAGVTAGLLTVACCFPVGTIEGAAGCEGLALRGWETSSERHLGVVTVCSVSKPGVWVK